MKFKETFTSEEVLSCILLIRILRKFNMLGTVFGPLKGMGDKVVAWDWKDETSDLEIEFESE